MHVVKTNLLSTRLIIGSESGLDVGLVSVGKGLKVNKGQGIVSKAGVNHVGEQKSLNLSAVKLGDGRGNMQCNNFKHNRSNHEKSHLNLQEFHKVGLRHERSKSEVARGSSLFKFIEADLFSRVIKQKRKENWAEQVRKNMKPSIAGEQSRLQSVMSGDDSLLKSCISLGVQSGVQNLKKMQEACITAGDMVGAQKYEEQQQELLTLCNDVVALKN